MTCAPYLFIKVISGTQHQEVNGHKRSWSFYRRIPRKWEVETLNGIERNGKKMKTAFNEDDLGELINSLQNMGRALRKIEKKLGIKEASLAILDLEESFKKNEERDEYNKFL
jgi:hypothetical protein